jgi:hypothetical protein
MAGAYQSLGFAGVSDAVFAAGNDLQLTTSYGFRGGYTHNWDARWNTAIYDAWAAVKHNAVATGLICANFATLATTGSNFTCNPDFSISQLGLITRWTPVANLTFSADVTWSHLDQKYTGALTLPAIAAAAKPGTTYELKDQDTVSMLIRAQRNF